ncbi:MAG: uroporphyrinogen decarboxylase [Chloroflexi bacterium]|nr:uroporphyrinogen decarboxylase [Chloroflexota bacterium]
MQKRTRLERALGGEPVDRPPVALWRHWPGDDQHAGALAASTLRFQQAYDWDFVKLTPNGAYSVRDWGVRSVWDGDPEGSRTITQRPIQTPEDWRSLRPLSPTQGMLGEMLQTLRGVRRGLGPATPLFHTVFSPLAQAQRLAGPAFFQHLRDAPDLVRAALDVITETTVDYLAHVRRAGADGLFYAVQWADAHTWTRDAYRQWGEPWDRQVLEAAAQVFDFILLHIHGSRIFFDLFVDYPVHAINWHDRETPPSLAEGLQRFKGAVVGGISQQTLAYGTVEEVHAEAQDALQQTGARRFILGTGCVTLITTPAENVRAVRAAVHTRFPAFSQELG